MLGITWLAVGLAWAGLPGDDASWESLTSKPVPVETNLDLWDCGFERDCGSRMNMNRKFNALCIESEEGTTGITFAEVLPHLGTLHLRPGCCGAHLRNEIQKLGSD